MFAGYQRPLARLLVQVWQCAYASDGEVQALQVIVLIGGDLQETGILVRDGTCHILVPCKRVFAQRRIVSKIKKRPRNVHLPVAIRVRVVPVSTMPAVGEKMGLPDVP